MPIPLYAHGMVNYGTDLVVMGGYSSGNQSSFYLLYSENGIFKWEKMKPELKIPREGFVAMTIPDQLLEDTNSVNAVAGIQGAQKYGKNEKQAPASCFPLCSLL